MSDTDDSHGVDHSVSSHFAKEFTAFAECDRDFDAPELLEYIFYSRTGLDPGIYDKVPGDPYRTSLPPAGYRPDNSFLKGKTVLDAGCGAGRFLPIAAGAAERVVGLDIGAHVERARSRSSNLPNVDIVQGSVLAPPFRSGAFDYVFSLGVLHHTPDPRRASLKLAELVNEHGAMSLWVYSPRYWGGPLRGAVGRRIHGRLSKMPSGRALWYCRRVLYPVGRLQMRLAERRWTKLLAAPFFLINIPRHPRREVMLATIYDYYAPPLISTHTYAEVRSWLEEGGFQTLRAVPTPTAWFAQRASARTPSSSRS